ncbi:DUF4115 domain-containing protein [Actinomadura craniellae]|uniref:DUF4115 domain-containing protein n=1 Tax=Actinomadura craniellae TaxID=2231787 RepID=A0A365H1D6_9ACTN|nr:helix-turn-helix domain-containing protein [Actinomadura craniellae]RAY12003.1 DUF4115 domain-containing protein [Actinomadura craniellae]
MSIGETLAQGRREAGLTVTQVSVRTRIRETVIRGIERDDYTFCGGNFYARGHIRSIARVVGVDPEPLVREYDEMHGGAPQPLAAATAFEPERPVPIREGRAPNWTAAMAAALALATVYALIQVFGGGGGERDVTQVAQPVVPSPTPTASPARPGPVAQAPRKAVEVQIKARRSSWLNVRDDKGKQLFSGLVRSGETKEWTARKRLFLVIGNGGGVKLVVNGKDLGTPGAEGQVLRVDFGLEDPERA